MARCALCLTHRLMRIDDFHFRDGFAGWWAVMGGQAGTMLNASAKELANE